jgi:hypothetical protein
MAPAWELVNWNNSAIVGYSRDCNEVSTDVEDSPLLRSVARKWQMKADWEHLACAVVIRKLWRLAIVL